jgi:competence protein ComEC
MFNIEKKEKIKFIIIGILILVDIFIFSIIISFYVPHKLKVVFFDVGQGDAIFVETPSRKQFLIDAGYNNLVLSRLGKEMSIFDRSLDAVFVSHPDSDHIGGIPNIFENYSVSKYFDSGVISDSALYSAVNETLFSKKISTTTLSSSDIVDFGDGVFVEILWPETDLFEKDGDTNKGSLVVKIIYGNTSFLLEGDAPQSVEKVLIFKDGKELDSDVLKVGHHGSKTSSLDTFISAVSPAFSIISAGKDNKFGHPNIETLDILNNVKTKILETFITGDIIFESDGDNVIQIQ